MIDKVEVVRSNSGETKIVRDTNQIHISQRDGSVMYHTGMELNISPTMGIDIRV